VKLKELSEGVAKTCDMPMKAVLKAQMETFRQLRVAVEGGERVAIPGFGIFFLKEIAAEDGKPAEKIVRLRMRDEVVTTDTAGKEKGERADRAEKRAARKQNAERAPEAAE
jgi:nucleoid DNA-binding protein